MRRRWTEALKGRLRPGLFRLLHPRQERFRCPVCGYHGPFKPKRVSRDPDLVRLQSKCPACGATERHRMQSLVLDELFAARSPGGTSLLHIAPEFCLQPKLRTLFETYHTADLCMPGVDFKEDIQALSFEDGSYDAVFVSRVLTIPPDLEAAVRELRRILRPGGIALISETYTHEHTRDFVPMRAGRSREIGIDVLSLYKRHFTRVEPYLSARYDAGYQLLNRMQIEGQPRDGYPPLIRVPGVGFQELIAVCYA